MLNRYFTSQKAEIKISRILPGSRISLSLYKNALGYVYRYKYYADWNGVSLLGPRTVATGSPVAGMGLVLVNADSSTVPSSEGVG